MSKIILKSSQEVAYFGWFRQEKGETAMDGGHRQSILPVIPFYFLNIDLNFSTTPAVVFNTDRVGAWN